MTVLHDLLGGFATVLTPENLMFAAIGVTLGTFVGVLPGIGPALTIALLLPITYDMDSAAGAFIMFAGIYYGAMYGGSTTSILLNTPGESASVAAAIEGHRMAVRGRAKAALATAAIGSFVAGTLSTIALTVFAAPFASLAVSFQASDYFALAVLAMVSVTALVGRSLLRGAMSLTLGLFIGVIGLDGLTSQTRFTFGMLDLYEGVDMTLVIVGLFAIGEALFTAHRLRTTPPTIEPIHGMRGWMTRRDWSRSWRPWLRGTAVGFPFGALPAGGADIPTFLSYTYEKHRSKHREEFGDGAIEGVAGPEAANNAAFSGVLIPLLTLGIPTSATAAVMLASFKQFDVQPGPQLFDASGGLVWALGVTGETPDGTAAPRLSDVGIDVEFTNWRGLMAPPGLPDDAVARHREIVERLYASPHWHDDLRRYEWTDARLPGEAFGRFIADAERETSSVLAELGLP